MSLETMLGLSAKTPILRELEPWKLTLFLFRFFRLNSRPTCTLKWRQQISNVLWYGTPRKIDIVPENDGLEDYFPFPGEKFSGSMSILLGVGNMVGLFCKWRFEFQQPTNSPAWYSNMENASSLASIVKGNRQETAPSQSKAGNFSSLASACWVKGSSIPEISRQQL